MLYNVRDRSCQCINGGCKRGQIGYEEPLDSCGCWKWLEGGEPNPFHRECDEGCPSYRQECPNTSKKRLAK